MIHDTKQETLTTAGRTCFEDFKHQSSTRLLLSLLPPCEHTEVIIRSAFEAGFNAGAGFMLSELIQTALKPKSDK